MNSPGRDEKDGKRKSLAGHQKFQLGETGENFDATSGKGSMA